MGIDEFKLQTPLDEEVFVEKKEFSIPTEDEIIEGMNSLYTNEDGTIENLEVLIKPQSVIEHEESLENLEQEKTLLERQKEILEEKKTNITGGQYNEVKFQIDNRLGQIFAQKESLEQQG